MWNDPATFASSFFAGLLAGEELVIRIGVRGPLARLDRRAHIEMRQGLIRTLRILVPSIFFAALFSGFGGIAVHWQDSGFALRLASVAALIAFIAITLGGTVPINQAVSGWDAAHLPANWEKAIARWERLDTVRTILAVAAFAFSLLAGR